MKELTVHKVRVTTIGKLVGVWYGILGLIAGLFGGISTGFAIVDANPQHGWLWNIAIVIVSMLVGVVFLPLISFVVGWVQGVILAVVFNVVSAASGGVKIDVSEEKVK